MTAASEALPTTMYTRVPARRAYTAQEDIRVARRGTPDASGRSEQAFEHHLTERRDEDRNSGVKLIFESMTYQTVLVEGSQLPILRVTLNRPEKRNAIGPTLVRELREVVVEFRDDPRAQVLVLTGAGDYFSAGADLSEMSGSGAVRPPDGWPDLLCAFHETGKPIIAKVNGPALAGGLGLMLACDLVVAADTAKFGTTEVRVGLWPMMITAEIVRNIGRKRALELMLTGKTITASRAEQIGLVNQVVPAAELEAETLALATTLTQRSPAVISAGLRAFYATQDEEFRPALRKLEAELFHILSLEDAREGLLAFMQKRPPVWKGR